MMGTRQIIGDSGYLWFLKCYSLRKVQVWSSTGELGKGTWPLLGMLESTWIPTKLCERYTVEDSMEGFCNIQGPSSFSGSTLSLGQELPLNHDPWNLVLLNMKENHLFLRGYPDIKKQQDRKIATSRVTSGMFTQRPSATGGFAKTQRIRDNFFNQHGKKKGQYTILTVIYRPIHDTCAVSTFQGLRVSFLCVLKTSFYFPFTHDRELPIINFSVNSQTTCSFAHHLPITTLTNQLTTTAGDPLFRCFLASIISGGRGWRLRCGGSRCGGSRSRFGLGGQVLPNGVVDAWFRKGLFKGRVGPGWNGKRWLDVMRSNNLQLTVLDKWGYSGGCNLSNNCWSHWEYSNSNLNNILILNSGGSEKVLVPGRVPGYIQGNKRL